MKEHMLSTVDNPYNPFHQFKEWDAWDREAGYYTLAYLGRIIITSDELSEADQSDALEKAIDEIVNENLYGMHIKVTADDETPRRVSVSIS